MLNTTQESVDNSIRQQYALSSKAGAARRAASPFKDRLVGEAENGSSRGLCCRLSASPADDG